MTKIITKKVTGKFFTLFFLHFLMTMVVPSTSQAQGPLTDYKLVNSEFGTVSSENLGTALAKNGNYLFAGAPSVNSGSVYMFSLVNGSYVKGTPINAHSGVASQAKFGASIASCGNWLMVGAPLDKKNSSTPSAFTGSVSFYQNVSNTWTLKKMALGYSIPSGFNSGKNNYGTAVAMNSSYAFAGMSETDTGSSTLPNKLRIGSVDIYKLTSGSWVLSKRLLNPDGLIAEQGFGSSVVCDENNLFITTLPNDGTNGTVFHYKMVSGDWVYQSKITEPSTQAYGFGSSISFWKDQLVVSAKNTDSKLSARTGKVFIYKLNSTNNWVRSNVITAISPVSQGQYGRTVYIEGNTLLIAYNEATNSPAGLVDMYEKSDTGWVYKRKFNNKAAADDNYGSALCIAGNFIICGSQKSDSKTLDVGMLEIFKTEDMIASDAVTDGYIDLNWRIAAWPAITSPPLEMYFQIVDSATQNEIYSKKFDDVSDLDFFSGTFRHYVKPGTSITYQARVLQYGKGILMTGPFSSTGKTKTFISPGFTYSTPTTSMLEKVVINLASTSTYADKLLIYRNGKLAAVVDSTVKEWEDLVNISDSNAIINGLKYNYCIEGINSKSGLKSSKICADGSTVPVNFQASDNSSGSVSLSWNNLGYLAQYYIIERDGSRLKSVKSNMTSYKDISAIPGQVYNYKLIIVSDNIEVLRQQDHGSLKANGVVSGYVINKTGAYGLEGVKVELSGTVDNIGLSRTATTDSRGYYAFTEVPYGQSTEFNIKVSKSNTAFTEVQKSVTLTLSATAKTADFESLLSGNVVDFTSGILTYDSFGVRPLVKKDMVRLHMGIKLKTGIAQVYLRRNEVIIHSRTITKDSTGLFFDDRTGIPKESYLYSMEVIQVTNSRIYRKKVSASSKFPEVAPLDSAQLTILANSANGTADMSWTHTSDNYTGIGIYLNGTKIIDYIPSNPLTGEYTELTGNNNQSHNYVFTPFRIASDNNRYESIDLKRSVSYPALKALASVSADTTSQGFYKVSWTYGFNPSTYNFTGVKIIRTMNGKTDTLVTVNRNNPAIFIDKTVAPGAAVQYSARVFKASYNLSTGTDVTPANNIQVMPPANFIVSSLNPSEIGGVVAISWSYNQPTSISGFRIIRSPDTLWVRSDINTITHALSGNYNNINHQFSISAFREINGIKYFSSLVTTSCSTMNVSSGKLPAPGNLKATDNLPDKVTLKWTYPSYYLPEFKIYRDGVYAGSVFNDARVYNSYETDGFTHTYSVMPVISSIPDKGTTANAAGRRAMGARVQGTASNINSGAGLPNKTIYIEHSVSGNLKTVATTVTDSNGFFTIESLSLKADKLYVISIDAQGGLVSNNHQEFYYNSNELLEFTFSDTSSVNNQQNSAISIPVRLKAVQNKSNASVILSWAAEGNNYSGFEVYRGLELLAKVASGSALFYEDKKGAPGVSYSYRIKSYWENEPGNKLESKFAVILADFPVLLPVSSLTATPFADYLQLTWNHESNKHTYYEIRKNGISVAKIPTDKPMLYNDTSGSPASSYLYQVNAVLDGNAGLYNSDKVVQSALYPEKSKVSAMTYKIDSNTVIINWVAGTPYTSAYTIYRDGQKLTTVKAGITTYADITGQPKKKYRYEVRASYVRNKTLFESKPIYTDINFPDMSRPSFLSTSQGQDAILVSWKYSSLASGPSYNGKLGFRIYRSTLTGTPVKIGEVSLGSANATATDFNYKDITGIPSAQYYYYISAFDLRSGTESESAKTRTGTVNFPALAAPSQVKASVNDVNVLKTAWVYPNADSSISFQVNNIYNRETTIYTSFLCSYNYAYTNLANEFKTVPGNSCTFDYLNYYWSGQTNIKTSGKCLIYDDVTSYYRYFLVRTIKTINGTPYYSGWVQVPVFNYTRLGNSEISSFTASDNAFTNKVNLQWVSSANAANVKAYNIYRDGVLIKAVNPADKEYDDEDGIVGKTYIYSILIDYTSGGTGGNRALSDYGSTPAIGKISGGAVTNTTGNGVPGVKISATALIDGTTYTYKSVTDGDGKYEIPKVYFADKAKYMVTAEYQGHIFENPVMYAALETLTPQTVLSDFRDKTAYLINGTITRKTGCSMDSVKLTFITRYNNGNPDKLESVYSNTAGKYALNINPNDPTLESIELVISDTQSRSDLSNLSTYHNFNIKSKKWANARTLGFLTTQDLTDNLLYPVNIQVRNTCGIIGAYKFNLDIRSDDGCYFKTVATAIDGSLQLELPAYNYTIAVSGASPADANITSIVDYLNVRPMKLSLKDTNSTGADLQLRNGTFGTRTYSMIYHKLPQLSIVSSLTYLCNNPANPIFLKQGDSAKMRLSVTEQHGSKKCHVDNGFIIVRNDASEQTTDTIFLNSDKTAFKEFSFMVGAPMVVDPYTKELIFEYHTASDGFLGELVKSVAIDGIANQEGSDVIVASKDNQQNFQIPVMVLRDPPGDESYSYIEKGSTFSRTLHMSDRNSGFGGVHTENQFEVFGVGAAFDAEIKASGGSGREASYNISVTAKERFETPHANSVLNADNTNFLLGSNGDVIVGIGVALRYGIGEKITIDNANCKISKTSIVTIAPEKINTTWVYTVDHIIKLVKDYRNDSTLLEQGLYEITGQTKDQTRSQLTTLIKNWESVLTYHFHDNVPFVQMCNTKNYDNLNEPFKTQSLTFAKEGFCKEIGIYKPNGEFVVNKDLKFTSDLIDKYNKIDDIQKTLSNQEFQFKFRSGMAFSQGALDDWKIGSGATQLYGSEAENITFSGNTSIEKSVTVAQTKSRSYTQFWSMDMEAFAGVVVEQDVKIITLAGFGVIVGSEKRLVNFNTKSGVIFGYNHEFEQNETNETVDENTTGYVLSDNDAGDQFSVTAFRGNDPMCTPYFVLLGGRSSCPPEPGTIKRDQPLIRLQDDQGNFVNSVQYDLDPGKILTLPVKFSNLSPQIFNDEHYFTLGQVQNMNRFGAKLTMNGTRLGTTEFRIPSGSAVFGNLEIERADKFYDYDDIYISLAASCPNLEAPDNYTANDHLIELHYRHPCSDVSILSPGDNWTIRKATTQANDQDEKLIVKIADYDVENPLLEKITLQFRRIGSDIWSDIQSLTRDSLKNYYLQNKSTYFDPTYPFVWNLKSNSAIPDGDYELRAQSWCGKGGILYSNVVRGKIDRTTVVLFGQPQPTDNLLSLGDEISVTFNKSILCGLNSANFSFTDTMTKQLIPATVSCFGNKLVFTFSTSMASLDGVIVRAKVTGIRDLNENLQNQDIEWVFKIRNNPVFWSPEKVDYELYKGKTAKLTASLLNTFSASQNYTLTVKSGSWLQVNPTSGLILPSGKDINLTVNATGLTPGTYTDTVIASIPGYSLLPLPVNITVYPNPVNWVVDPARFEGSATVICNYSLDSSTLYSTDTLDRIAAFINGELRGVTNIVKAGTYYRAYMNISGNASDAGKPIEFNVWNAKSGIEYAAHMRSPINYSVNGFYGTTIAPRILDVNSLRDSIRNIPLKAGWNYLAFNTTSGNGNVSSVLSRLKATDGDLIKTLDKTSYFNAASGAWINTNGGLSQINTNEGYMIRLAKADTLKAFGNNAPLEGTFKLEKGWNLIGNPYQVSMSINDALNGAGFSNSATIKNDFQSADYDSSALTWNGFTNLQINKSYLLRNGKSATISYKRSADLECKDMVKNNFEFNTTFLAVIKLDGVVQANADDKIVAFSGDKCRGTGQLEFVPALNKYVLNIFVYSNTLGETISFRIYNKASNAWYDVADSIKFNGNASYGSPYKLYEFSNRKDANTGINNANINAINASVFPNPFNNDIRISIQSDRTYPVTAQLTDVMGRVIKSEILFVNSGSNIRTLNTRDLQLTDGIYFITLSDPYHAPVTIKLLKQN